MEKKKLPETLSGMSSRQVSTMLDVYRPMIAQAIPKHLTADRMIQIAVTAILQDTKLKECTIPSVIGAVMQSSILGFRPVPSLGECYFVAYKNRNTGRFECQFQIGYRGMLKLAYQNRRVTSIHAYAVHEGDQFTYQLGVDPMITHVPVDDSGRMTHVYAVAKLDNGGVHLLVMTREKVEKLRKRNAMQGVEPSGAWLTDYDEMAKAKVIKALCKVLPLSDDDYQAINSDGAIINADAISNTNAGVQVEALVYPEIEEHVEVQTINENSDGKEKS